MEHREYTDNTNCSRFYLHIHIRMCLCGAHVLPMEVLSPSVNLVSGSQGKQRYTAKSVLSYSSTQHQKLFSCKEKNASQNYHLKNMINMI